MAAPTTRQAILRRDACRSLMVALVAIRCGCALHAASGWLLDRLEVVARRQRLHASDLAVLGGLAPVPERLRGGYPARPLAAGSLYDCKRIRARLP